MKTHEMTQYVKVIVHKTYNLNTIPGSYKVARDYQFWELAYNWKDIIVYTRHSRSKFSTQSKFSFAQQTKGRE